MTLAIGRGAIIRPALWRLTLYAGLVLLGWEAVRYFGARAELGGKLIRVHGFLVAVAGILLVVGVAVWRIRIV
jgi:hypothetical protein